MLALAMEFSRSTPGRTSASRNWLALVESPVARGLAPSGPDSVPGRRPVRPPARSTPSAKEGVLGREASRCSGRIANGLTGAPVRDVSGHRWPSRLAVRGLPMLLRKEVIQPHLPVRLPCYDFTPIANPTFDGSLHKGWATGFGCYRLSWCDGRCVQGPGTYSPRRC